MSIGHEVPVNLSNPLKSLELALQEALASGKNKKEADFKEAYPLIEQNLAKKVPFKIVMETFNKAYGYTLHAPRFRKFLLDERKRRSEAGDELLCNSCGQAINQHENATAQSNDVDGL